MAVPARTRGCRIPSLEAIAAPWCPHCIPERPAGHTAVPPRRDPGDSALLGSSLPGPAGDLGRRCCRGRWSSRSSWGAHALLIPTYRSDPGAASLPAQLSDAVPICLLHASSQPCQAIGFHFYFSGTCNGFNYLRPFLPSISFSELANWFIFLWRGCVSQIKTRVPVGL